MKLFLKFRKYFFSSSQTLLSDADRAGRRSRSSGPDSGSGHEGLRPRTVRPSRGHARPEEVPLQRNARRPQGDQRQHRRIRRTNTLVRKLPKKKNKN